MARNEKREIRVTVMLNEKDMEALEYGMRKVRETSMSHYIRRLIHEKCTHLPSEIPPSFRTP